MVAPHKNATIHVIDDEPEVGQTICEELGHLGFIAISYTQAAHIMPSPGDIVLIDHYLQPGDKLHCDPETISLISMSADPEVCPDLLKPFSASEVAKAIDKKSLK